LIWAYKARLAKYAQIKQKYLKWIVHRKLRVSMSMISCHSEVQ
jgi:hypothetical protein